MLARYSDAVVHDLDKHPARFVRALPWSLVLGDHFDNGAFSRGRVSRVEEKIEQHLLNFVVVGECAAEVGRENRLNPDTAETLVVGDEPQSLGDKAIDVDRLALRSGRPCEIYKILERARD